MLYQRYGVYSDNKSIVISRLDIQRYLVGQLLI